jgi:hypothetical protein
MVRGKEDNHEEICGKSYDRPHRENSSALKCKNTYLCVYFLMKINMEFDARCEIHFIIYRLPLREPFVNVKLNRNFIACYMFL